MGQLVKAIDYYQSKNVCHLDLKPENIMIDSDFNLKIIDFGFAMDKNIGKLTNYVGTRSYVAPEVL